MASRSASYKAATLPVFLFISGCSGEGVESRNTAAFPESHAAEALAPKHEAPVGNDDSRLSGHCTDDGHCQAELADMDDAMALCDGSIPRLYWSRDANTRLLACECDCSSHDNAGWLVYGPERQVSGVALGKAALPADLVDARYINDSMASHPFCGASDSSGLSTAEFISLIKYPTGDDRTPYCFSVRTFSISSSSLIVKEDGNDVTGDEDVIVETPADIADRVREVMKNFKD